MKERVYTRSLLKTEVLSSMTGERLGRVADILISPDVGPDVGRIIGLVIGRGNGRGWLVRDFEFRGGALMVSKEALTPLDEYAGGYINEGRAVSVVDEIIGARVVTTHGTLLGRVSEAGFSNEGSLAIFRISKSFFQNLFRRGVLIRSDAPKSYLKDGTGSGARLIVPSELSPGELRAGGLSIIRSDMARYGVFTAAALLALGLIGSLLAQ